MSQSSKELAQLDSVAILNTSSALAASNAKESLDLALIFGSYEQAPRLFFSGDGVYQLVKNQALETVQQKDFLRTFSAFEFYDIEEVFVCRTSLEQRGFNTQEPLELNIDGAAIVDKPAFLSALNQHAKILKF